jgi:NIPSNAP
MEGDPNMDRRSFAIGSLGAALGPTLAAAGTEAQVTSSTGARARPQILELRRYQFRFGAMQARHTEYAKTALVPALNRAGIKPVGAFNLAMGPGVPALYLLLPHANAESVVTLSGKLVNDDVYKQAAASFRSLPPSDPPYVRRESSLMLAFDSVPAVEIPVNTPTRVFEMRTYESHNEGAGLKKIEMFEKAGELALFRKLGLAPVFFGRDIVGPRMPSLTYMVAFPDMAAREKGWATFGEDPEWVKLRSTPGYSNADIMTNITMQLLRPTDYSQV